MEAENARALGPRQALALAWAGLGLLWVAHLHARVTAASGPAPDVVRGVIERVRPMRAGGAMVGVLDETGQTRWVRLGPSLGQIDGLEAGRQLEARGVRQSQGRIAVIVPTSSDTVTVAGAPPVITVAAAALRAEGSEVWLRAAVRDVVPRESENGITSARCVVVDASGSLVATMKHPREADLALLESGKVVLLSGRVRTSRGSPGIALRVVAEP